MSEKECSHNCSECSSNCDSRTAPQKKNPGGKSKIKKIIGVVSGKGGVGKSSVTALLATRLQQRGKKVAILDGDVTGPSIPKMFGVTDRVYQQNGFMQPILSSNGIKLMSMNLLLENPSDPVVWRGPVISGVVEQFFTESDWGDVDFMFVDMPPGTGDVPLTVFQSLPIDGIVIVTSPQNLVEMIVEKAVNMANLMGIPLLGIVENMSYFICDKCGEKHFIYGESDIENVAKKFGFKAYAQMPINPAFTKACDMGNIEGFIIDWVDEIANQIEKV